MKKFMILEENALKLGNFLKEKRKEKNMTITDIEEVSGINRADVHRLESGQKKRLNPFQLAALAQSLDINSIDLYILAGFITEKAITEFVKEKTDERIVEQLKIISYTGANKIPVYSNFNEALGIKKNATPENYTTIFFDDVEEEAKHIGIIMEKSPFNSKISNNAIIILKQTKKLNTGDLGVFNLNGEILIKNYMEKEDNIILYLENSHEIPLLINDYDKIEIYGKIIRTINSI